MLDAKLNKLWERLGAAHRRGKANVDAHLQILSDELRVYDPAFIYAQPGPIVTYVLGVLSRDSEPDPKTVGR